MKHTKYILLLLFIIMAAGAQAQNRIGFVNPQKVLDQMPEKSAIEQRMADYYQTLLQEYENRAASFQEMIVVYQERESQYTPQQLAAEQQTLAQKQQELAEFENAVPVLMQRRQGELMRPIIMNMNEIIGALATELKLDYVINEQIAANQFPLVFVSDTDRAKYDLTDRVIERMKN